MATFLPCPSCGRHVRTSEHACPFCRHGERGRDLIGRILSPLPELLPALVLGLSIAACDGPRPAEKYGAPPPPDPVVEPEATTKDSAGAEAGGANLGEDAGAEVAPDPRPAEKYGGPPMPDDEPELKPTPDDKPKPDDGAVTPTGNDQITPEPRPAKKYGGPPKPGPDDKPPIDL